ncbi:MAG: hypothetical protein ACT4O2_06980 [Beijerinckiaceae bacterium]
MNMQFPQTSGSRPELDSGTRTILKYDGETANGQAVSFEEEIFMHGSQQKQLALAANLVALEIS